MLEAGGRGDVWQEEKQLQQVWPSLKPRFMFLMMKKMHLPTLLMFLRNSCPKIFQNIL